MDWKLYLALLKKKLNALALLLQSMSHVYIGVIIIKG